MNNCLDAAELQNHSAAFGNRNGNRLTNRFVNIRSFVSGDRLESRLAISTLFGDYMSEDLPCSIYFCRVSYSSEVSIRE